MNMEALNKIGMVMQATGMGLKGQDGSAVYTRYNEDQEKAKRKEAIGGLMERLNIAGPKRDFLSTLPLEQQQELMWEMMNPEPVRGVVAGDKLINPFDGSIMGNYGPEPYTSEELAALTGTVSPEFAQHVPGIFAGESGGDFNALFGYSNRPGGRFEGVNLTDMTVDEAIQFSRPDGEYAKWVAAQNGGTVATPMGGFQVVGRTLRHIKQELGLTGQEKMTPELQMKIGEAIYRTQGTGAWEGYKPGRPAGGGQPARPEVAQLDKRINDYTALLAKSKGSPEIRKQMEFKRSELVKQRDAILGEKEPFRIATAEEAARYGAQAGQFGPDGRFYPITPPQGFEMISDGEGGVTFRQGAGVGNTTNTSQVETEKTAAALKSVDAGLTAYENIYKQGGGAIVPGKQKDALIAARRDLQLQMKELFNLGVLNGPDLDLMNELIVDTTDPKNLGLDALGVADLDERVRANVKQLREQLHRLAGPKLERMGMSVDDVLGGAGALPPPPTGYSPVEWEKAWNVMSEEDRALFQ